MLNTDLRVSCGRTSNGDAFGLRTGFSARSRRSRPTTTSCGRLAPIAGSPTTGRGRLQHCNSPLSIIYESYAITIFRSWTVSGWDRRDCNTIVIWTLMPKSVEGLQPAAPLPPCTGSGPPSPTSAVTRCVAVAGCSPHDTATPLCGGSGQPCEFPEFIGEIPVDYAGISVDKAGSTVTGIAFSTAFPDSGSIRSSSLSTLLFTPA